MKMRGMTIEEYQKWADTTNLAPDSLPHLLCGLGEEVGEILGLFKRVYREDPPDHNVETLKDGTVAYSATVPTEALKEELGDLLWGMVNLASFYGVDFQKVIDYNVEKCERRMKAGTIQGRGDR